MQKRRPTLLIDFDAVIHEYHGWNGGTLGKPLGGARAAMYLLERTHRLVLFTARTNPEELRAWLRTHGFPTMKVTNIKEPAHLIIDDRALTFPGTWSDHLVKRITSFSPYWEGEGAGDSPEDQPEMLHPSEAEPREP